MAKKTIRVYRDGDVWVAKKDGTTKASAIRNTQKEAYLAARNIALNQGLTITVYYPTGGIQKVVHPKEKGAESDCFITTACVKYYNLSDDCYELNTLRNYRDTYLVESAEGKALVKQYYAIAPELVKKMTADPNRDILFKSIFDQIRQACLLIDSGKYDCAKMKYISVVTELVSKYNTD